MKPICIIKSHPKGITLVMDDSCDFVELVEEICRLFAKSREFFGNDELLLAVEGRTLTAEETLVVIEAIELNSNVRVPLIIEEGEVKDARMAGHLDRYYYDRTDTNAKIIKGNVVSGEMVASETGLVIIGDVKKGASAFAAGNIMIFGSLEGRVCAGTPDDEDAFIVAGRVDTDEVAIGRTVGSVEVYYKRILGRKKATEPIVIRSLAGRIVAEPMSGGLIKQK